MRRSPGSSREPRLTTSTAVLAVASALILLMLSFNARLYFSAACDQRLQQLADEKDRELQRLARRDLVAYVDWTPGALTPSRIAVLVIAYNRASYLDRALGSVMLRHPGGANWPVYVSQDGENDEVARDDTLLAVSAFNDNGQPRYSSDTSALYRSDFFPGLGWLLTRRLWAEIGAGWPEERGFWDDWMREPPQRQGRASIRPETSRSRTFGQKGTSLSQFYIKFLAPIQFSDQAAPAWAGRNLSFLLKAAYDPPFAARVAAAREVELRRVIDRSFTASGGGDVVVRYSTPKVLLGFCKQLGIMEDLKAGVPRTAYHGVIPLRVGGVMVFLAPSFAVDQDITQRKPP
ncbi:hypothetical protein EMIHUDRAFT_252190 [Emiliania huxleyi CCMP1516]|uniref:alpha-1,3-mannosyl-glycoprotein 2-beta-N-acetylglucosaminyltransferase n=2 Tax=Emiliania huxleyi TaxID=2903 RepID=A0A0D3KMX3_EMIH1|nr:hypothetical protein EMIHUDRAFT_252190 [Emiliania huxleyi CCMP1516]EOD37108.1 hypothetical protein EMIHUDRAFT_252190 [Emiliania huxleyi CCMP1516]|eukprot:XP_005789537.1 hypothetical protein EMIHUDRAFT_252190 [Emiliania huxleyi CCMP1516]